MEERLARMRRTLLRLVLGVVVVDLAGIAIYMLTGIRTRPDQLKVMTAIWLVATLAVVLPNLRAIRRMRNETIENRE